MVQLVHLSALASAAAALLAAPAAAHPLDYSSGYAPGMHLVERANSSSSSALDTCLSKSGATLTYPSAGSSYSTLTVAENSNYHVRPDVVAQPSSAAQVSAVIKCVAANKGQTKITPRSGGHGYAAYALTGNVVLDFAKMVDLTVDEGAKTVRVGAGMTLGPLAKAIGAKGYALPHGTCPTVGVSGHGLGGGWGYASRSWGWLMDHSE